MKKIVSISFSENIDRTIGFQASMLFVSQVRPLVLINDKTALSIDLNMKAISNHYTHFLVLAMLKALGVEFTSIKSEHSKFPRDAGFVLPKQGVYLVPHTQSNFPALASKLNHLNYTTIEVPAFFEGGNCFQVGKILFHGSNPWGGYLDQDGAVKLNRNPRDVISKLKDALEDRDIDVESLYVKDKYKETFYHLDTFLTDIDEGPVVVYNLSILNKASIQKLKRAAKRANKSLIDLEGDLKRFKTLKQVIVPRKFRLMCCLLKQTLSSCCFVPLL